MKTRVLIIISVFLVVLPLIQVSNPRPPDYEYCLSWRTVRVYQINWHSNQAELPRHVYS